ncbi:MAG: hypothetical protein LLF97_07835 [Planctomycetaceae bacterium]|nr:hypothetical protein [Planctomycetaceae bacterium]
MNNDTIKARQLIAFGVSMFVGAFIWLSSPYITGQREPWDPLSFYYGGSLLVGGFAAGLFMPRPFWLWAVGIWLSQVIGFVLCVDLSPRGNPLWLFGLLVFLPVFSLFGLLGTFLGAAVATLRSGKTAQRYGEALSSDSTTLNKADAIHWQFAIGFLLAVPVLVHALFRGAYKVPDHGTFWIGPISTSIPYVFLTLLFLAHCVDLGLKPRRSAYCGAVAAWIGMMALTLFIVCHTPGHMTSTMGLAMAFTPVCYLPFLVVPYFVGTIVGKLWTRWKAQ